MKKGKTAKKAAKKRTKSRQAKAIARHIRFPRVRQVTVRYGGVIRTGTFENRRVSFEMTADCPRSANPNAVCNYIEGMLLRQFYDAQIEAVRNLPDEMRDEIGSLQGLPTEEAAHKIGEFFRNYTQRQKQLDPEQRRMRIEELGREMKELAPKIKAETKRLKGLKEVTGDDIKARAEMINRIKEIRNELRNLR